MSLDTPLTDVPASREGWRFDNSFSRLPESFFVRLSPVPVREPRLVLLNRPLCAELGLDAAMLETDDGVAQLAGNRIAEGAEPLALAYSGHQFGSFTTLGDGRAILLGEQLTPDGRRYDIQLKGSGRTPFSRGGDGRAALGPMLREYLISEAMHSLGIPTTRSLAVVTTGEAVFRETRLRGAILTRVAASHIRVGAFEHLASRNDREGIRILTDYTIRRHFPECAGAGNPALALLAEALERQAALVAQWLQVGFIHGVMNTDNMALSGETLDYGPCAFMDAYDPETVFSSIDQTGRYAFGNQPAIARWNLTRLAETLLPLLHRDEKESIAMAEEAMATFSGLFQTHRLAGIRSKLGLFNEEEGDSSLMSDFLACLQRCGADYTNSFRALATELQPDFPLFHDPGFAAWRQRWQERLSRQPQTAEESRRLMRSRNPAVIPRNHRVEEALAAAVERDDYTVLENLLRVLSRPYDDLPERGGYHLPPERVVRPTGPFAGHKGGGQDVRETVFR
jgi:uncharacterized protein YdiU (UPF0061 family)